MQHKSKVLDKTIFPLSELTKKEVRDIAKSMNLSTFEKKIALEYVLLEKGPSLVFWRTILTINLEKLFVTRAMRLVCTGASPFIPWVKDKD